MNDAAAGLGPPERLHPVSMLSSLAASARGMWGLFAAGGYFAIQGNWFLLLVTLAIYAFMSVGSAILRWLNFEFQVGANEIQIDSGFFNRRHRSIPFDRVQDVTIEQGPLARALGLSKVRFETGGGSTPVEGGDEGALDAIPLGRAAEIRELVRARRGLASSLAAEADDADDIDPIYAMDLRRVMLAGIFNFSLAVVGAIIGASQTFGDVIGFDPFSRSFWNNVLAASEPLQRFLAANQLVVAVAGSLLLILIGLGTGVGRTLLRDYGFRLERTETGLRRRRGLFTVTDVVLPARRTQAAVIASGPVREHFGWHELKLQSLAKEVGGKDDHVVAPLARADEAEQVLQGIGWRGPGSPEWRRVSRAYVLGLALALSPFLMLTGAVALVLIFAPLLIDPGLRPAIAGGLAPALFINGIPFLALVLVILMRFLAWRRYAYALAGDRLLVRSGWWRRRIRILPLTNVQSVDFLQSFISRWLGTANLVIGVAGGGLAGHGIKSLPSETAREIRGQLLSGYR